MEKKPWPLIILGILHLIEPVGKVLLYSWLWKVPPSTILSYASLDHPYRTLMFFCSFPIAGIAILSVRNWSIPLFILIQVLTTIEHYRSWTQIPERIPFYIFAGFTFLNFMAVVYFLIPEVRLTYVNPRLRWWQTKSRYKVQWVCIIRQGDVRSKAVIRNISEDGLFLSTPPQITLDQITPVRVEFCFHKLQFLRDGMIVNESVIEGLPSFGVRFGHVLRKEKRRLRNCMRALDLLQFETRIKSEPLIRSFICWVSRLLKTGRGWVPEVPISENTPDPIDDSKRDQQKAV